MRRVVSRIAVVVITTSGATEGAVGMRVPPGEPVSVGGVITGGLVSVGGATTGGQASVVRMIPREGPLHGVDEGRVRGQE